MGSEMNVVIKASLKDNVNSRDRHGGITGTIPPSWGAFGLKANSNINFTSGFKDNSNFSKTETHVYQSGQDRGEGISSLDLEQANEELLGFNKISTKGTGIITMLKAYENHKDFIEAIRECTNTRSHILVSSINDKIYRELVGLKNLDDWVSKDSILEVSDKKVILKKIAIEMETIKEKIQKREITSYMDIADHIGTSEIIQKDYEAQILIKAPPKPDYDYPENEAFIKHQWTKTGSSSFKYEFTYDPALRALIKNQQQLIEIAPYAVKHISGTDTYMYIINPTTNKLTTIRPSGAMVTHDEFVQI